MQCSKCGSDYAVVTKTNRVENGRTVDEVYCAQCKATYSIIKESSKPIDCIPLIDIKLDGFYNKNPWITICAKNGVIGYLSSIGEYAFYAYQFCYFSYNDDHHEIRFNTPSGMNTDNPNEYQCYHSVRVYDIKIYPEFETKISNVQAYNLKDDACGGKVPQLSEDLVNELNSILLCASSRKDILNNKADEHNDRLRKKRESQHCYIATAVYGSYDCPQVWTLRRYRDYSLAATWHGRIFIRVYYAISPSIVKWFGDKEWFIKMWRDKLDIFVSKLNLQGVEDTPYNDPN